MSEKDFYPFRHEGNILEEGNRAVVRHPSLGHLCGYVLIKDKNCPVSWRGNYDADALQYLAVHGGLTYCEHHPSAGTVFGFDCSHCDDDKNPDLRDPKHVMDLTRQMEDQILLYATRLGEWHGAGRDRRIEIMQEIIDAAETKTELGLGAMLGMMCGAEEFGAGEKQE